MARVFVFLGGLSAALAILLGAFAAHTLKERISPEALAAFQTGVQYHLYHSLGLILTGLVSHTVKASAGVSAAGWGMAAGTVLFSGSLYVLSLTGIRAVAYVTPVGGTLFVFSWALLAMAVLRN